MHSNTAKYLDYLHLFVDGNRDEWFRKYKDVVGISISHKYRDKVEKRSFAIVFHVLAKKVHPAEDQMIPPHFVVSIPGRGEVTVPTDVVATGEFHFTGEKAYVSSGCTVRNLITDETGTLGPIVEDARIGSRFILGNMHVLGRQYLDNNVFNCDAKPESAREETLELGTVSGAPVSGYFYKGRFGEKLDCALAGIAEESAASLANWLPMAGRQNGVTSVDSSRYFGRKVLVLTNGRRVTRAAVINSQSVSVRVHVNSKGVTLHDLLQLKPLCCGKGDSGSPVFDGSGNVYGIILGMDRKFSYAAKIQHALEAFDVKVCCS